MNEQNLLFVTFKDEIKPQELPLLRGAIIHSMDKESTLFHNHVENDKLRYSYPLIQYKSVQRHPAVVCLNEGTEAIGEFFSAEPKKLMLGHRLLQLEVDHIDASIFEIKMTDQVVSYSIRQWLPLNQNNYKAYRSMESLAEKVAFLQSMLTANILSFLKGMDIRLDSKLEVRIIRLQPLHHIIFKGIRMMAFNATFKTNITLPSYIGLGKGASLGYGTLYQLRQHESNDKL